MLHPSSMTSDHDVCSICGAPLSGLLESNCPTCLMRLGAPTLRESGTGVTSANAGGEIPGPSRRIGDYELIEEIAHGGMGVVYRAVQAGLKRGVAIKIMLTAEFANETARKRFHREAESAASLHHPNIVSIYDIGEQNGQPYFSMELIEGQNLADLAREKPFAARDAARLIKTLAEAVQYAHEHGVLHRDLKPSNVLIDHSGEPHITDFGLAKQIEPGADLTMTGQVLGTPSYMPPEQAEPKRGPTTAASDVYSLGAIFYHLLTARPPFVAETLTQTLRLVAEGEPVSPRLLNPGVPRDLETICFKCLEKEPGSRYATAGELADELRRFLNDEPIRARPVAPPARLARWCRRKPSLALALGGVLALLFVLAIGSPIAIFRINRARKAAELAQGQTREQLYTALVEQARATVRSGELGHRVHTLDAIRRAAAITNTAELRREAMTALALTDLRFERKLPNDQEFINVAVDPFFQRIARCGQFGPISIRSTLDGRLLMTLPASIGRRVAIERWSPDGRFLATLELDEDTHLEIWDVSSAQRLARLNGPFEGVAKFHPYLPELMTCKGTTATVWGIEHGEQLAQFEFPGGLQGVTFSPDGERFAAAYYKDPRIVVTVRRFPDGTPLASADFTSIIGDLAWHPSGRWIGATDGSGNVHLIDAQSGQYRTLGRHKAEAATAVFSPDGRYLISGGWERELLCWDLRGMERAFSIPLNSFYGAFRSDGAEYVVITKSACLFHSFERPTAHREFAEEVHGQIRSAAFSQDGRWLAVSDQAQLSVWDLAGDGPCAAVAQGDDARLFFSATGELFTTRENRSSRWRIRPGTNGNVAPILTSLVLPPMHGVVSIVPVSDSVVVTSDQTSRLICLDGLKEMGWKTTSLAGPSAVSPDGRLFAIFSPFSTFLRVYRLPGLESAAELDNEQKIASFEFSPRSDEIAVATAERIELWSTATWKRTGEIPNFKEMRYAPNERAWWLTSDARSAGLYDASTRQPLLPLPTGMLPLATSQDGRFLAVTVDGRKLQVWDLLELRKSLKDLGIDWAKN